jgi:ABC-type sugar transport system permease subunit
MLYSLRITIPQELFESADVDGAPLLYKFRFITWPLLKNSYVFFTVLSTIWVIGSFTTPWLMTGGSPGGTTYVAATIGYFYYFTAFEPAKGLAATMSFLPLILLLLVIVMRLRGKVSR